MFSDHNYYDWRGRRFYFAYNVKMELQNAVDAAVLAALGAAFTKIADEVVNVHLTK